jgi:hypothetical protein
MADPTPDHDDGLLGLSGAADVFRAPSPSSATSDSPGPGSTHERTESMHADGPRGRHEGLPRAAGATWQEKRNVEEASAPSRRALRARLAAHALHAGISDAAAHTAPARAAFLARFEREVDPDGALDPRERARRAEHARKAYFLRLALASAHARSARRGGGGPAHTGDR